MQQCGMMSFDFLTKNKKAKQKKKKKEKKKKKKGRFTVIH